MSTVFIEKLSTNRTVLKSIVFKVFMQRKNNTSTPCIQNFVPRCVVSEVWLCPWLVLRRRSQWNKMLLLLLISVMPYVFIKYLPVGASLLVKSLMSCVWHFMRTHDQCEMVQHRHESYAYLPSGRVAKSHRGLRIESLPICNVRLSVFSKPTFKGSPPHTHTLKC